MGVRSTAHRDLCARCYGCPSRISRVAADCVVNVERWVATENLVMRLILWPLGDRSARMTTDYSVAELHNLHNAANRLQKYRKNLATTVRPTV